MRWRWALCGVAVSGLALAAFGVVAGTGQAFAAPETPAAPETKPVPQAPASSSAPLPGAPAAAGGASTESIQQAICRLIDASARRQGLPVEFFTRLIWQESSFRTGAVSSAGAQGVAQFMPGTAAERGLLDPFDPEQAIPKSAELLRDHVKRFGNIGLAAAAYNGGPGRVANWLAERGGLPEETRSYVYRITGRSAEAWAEERRTRTASDDQATDAPQDEEASEAKTEVEEKPKEAASAHPAGSCLQVVALLRRSGPGRGDGGPAIALASLAPWGVQLAGNFSKDLALASYARARTSYASLLGDVRPMVIGTRLRSRGTRTFYRVRVPATTRTAADQLCNRIRQSGGACVVLPS